MEVPVNAMIKKVSEDYERMKYNTAIAQMMSLVNAFYAKGQVTRGELRILCLLLNPVSPHITEEMWERMGHEKSIALSASWPASTRRRPAATRSRSPCRSAARSARA